MTDSAETTGKKTLTYRCSCTDNKIIKAMFDGGQTGRYAVMYCQRCFDQDDKEFLIGSENLERQNVFN